MALQAINYMRPQTCAVCGDQASGHHYETASCHGCKNFFRRAIVGMKVFQPCPSKADCLLADNSVALKRCRSCRFARCIERGMNPLAVVSAVAPDHNPVVQLVLKRRQRLRQSEEQDAVMVLEMGPKTAEAVMGRLIDQLAFLERSYDKIRCSRFSPEPEDSIPLAELIRGHSKFGYDFGEMPSRKQPPDPPTDVIVAIDKKRSPCLDKCAKVWPHANLVYAIEYLKTFEFFHNLSADERRNLARSVVAVCAHLTMAYFSYRARSSVTCHPDGSSVAMTCEPDWDRRAQRVGGSRVQGRGGIISHKCKHCSHCKQHRHPWGSAHRRQFHCESIERIRELAVDEREYVLLKAIAVCDPTIAELTAGSSSILDEQRCRYVKSLLSYMTARRGSHEAPARLLDLLRLIDWYRSVNERRKEQHLLRAAMGMRPWYCAEDSSNAPVLQDELFL